MVKAANEGNLYNARMGRFKGEESVFTHRDPSNDYIWGEDLSAGREKGRWVDSRNVEWIG